MNKILAKRSLTRFRRKYHSMSQKERMKGIPFSLTVAIDIFGTDNLLKTNSAIHNNIKGLPCIIFGKQLVLKIIDELLG